jgi:hypothetical protein
MLTSAYFYLLHRVPRWLSLESRSQRSVRTLLLTSRLAAPLKSYVFDDGM